MKKRSGPSAEVLNPRKPIVVAVGILVLSGIIIDMVNAGGLREAN